MSNAYQSRNIYRMVSPRKPILYQSFDELLRDNFEIYTRNIYLGMDDPKNDHLNYKRNFLDIVSGIIH